MIEAEEIVERYHQRRKAHQPRIAKMAEVKAAYEGDINLPLPELARDEKPLVANLVNQGIDQTANRVVSTMPNVTCPPVRPGFDRHEENAADRRSAIYGFWSMNRLNLIQRKRARWLITFASAPVMIRPDPVRRIPLWQARSPMSALPPPGDDLTPVDMIFTYRRSLGWLKRIYPDSIAALDVGDRTKTSPDDEFTLVDYCDADEIVTVVLGAAPTADTGGPVRPVSLTTITPGVGMKRGGKPFVELERWKNRAGICPAVVPSRIGLDAPQGQFDGILGLYWNQAMLMALETIAIKRSIFPDRWKMARPNETIQTIVEADGLAGIVGEIQGGMIQDLSLNPGVQAMPLINTLERSIRVSAGIPAEMTGESASNIRTARRGAQVLSSAIDFAIQEMQEVLEASLEEENTRAIAIDKAYFGKAPKSFWFDWNGTKGRGEYVPSELWTTTENYVRYSFPGADMNELVVGTGQRLGMETMSHYRAMEIDPMIEDPDLERDRITGEGLERAFMQGLQQQVAQGQIPPDDAAFIVQQVVAKRVPLFEAVQRAQQRAQQRQASAPSTGPAESPEALPAGSPETMPGLAAGPEGAAAASIAPPAPSMDNLAALMSTMRRTGG